VTPDDLAQRHPRLYHVTSPGAWDSMRRLGLLSTEALLRRAGLADDDIIRLTTQRRAQRVTLRDTPLGRLVLNDNTPLCENKLAACLDDGLAPKDWLRMLNQRVFFWVDVAAMTRLRQARANRRDPREVLVFDTRALISAHFHRVEIAPFNTGNTRRAPVRRGLATFTPVSATTWDAWRWARRPHKASPDKIVEVVVRDGVLDIANHLVDHWEANGRDLLA